MNEEITIRVTTSTVEEITYRPDRGYHKDAGIKAIALMDAAAIESGELKTDDLRVIHTVARDVQLVEIIDAWEGEDEDD